MARLVRMKIDQKLNVLRLLWLSFLLSSFLMVGLVFLITQSSTTDNPSTPFSSPLTLGLACSGLVMAVLALSLQRIAFASRDNTQQEGIQQGDRAGRAQSLYLVRLALLEGVTVLGLVCSMVSRNSAEVLPFAAVAWIGLILSRPTPELLRTLSGEFS